MTTQRGRGRVTALLFSPEREPVRSWRHLQTFWAKLAEVPGAWYVSKDLYPQGGWSTDGVFGALIDTRQVHKLPVGWLLLLLLVYLVVIGPLDQFWLKRIGRPMLTWILSHATSCFSRSSFISSVTSCAPVNPNGTNYMLSTCCSMEITRNCAGILIRRCIRRPISATPWRANRNLPPCVASFPAAGMRRLRRTGAADPESGDSFKADIFVPVWTSELFVSDWWQSASIPLAATLRQVPEGLEIKVENKVPRSSPSCTWQSATGS